MPLTELLHKFLFTIFDPDKYPNVIAPEIYNIFILTLSLLFILWAVRIARISAAMLNLHAALRRHHVLDYEQVGGEVHMAASIAGGIRNLQQLLRGRVKCPSVPVSKIKASSFVHRHSIRLKTDSNDSDKLGLSFNIDTQGPCVVQVFWNVNAKSFFRFRSQINNAHAAALELAHRNITPKPGLQGESESRSTSFSSRHYYNNNRSESNNHIHDTYHNNNNNNNNNNTGDHINDERDEQEGSRPRKQYIVPGRFGMLTRTLDRIRGIGPSPSSSSSSSSSSSMPSSSSARRFLHPSSSSSWTAPEPLNDGSGASTTPAWRHRSSSHNTDRHVDVDSRRIHWNDGESGASEVLIRGEGETPRPVDMRQRIFDADLCSLESSIKTLDETGTEITVEMMDEEDLVSRDQIEAFMIASHDASDPSERYQRSSLWNDSSNRNNNDNNDNDTHNNIDNNHDNDDNNDNNQDHRRDVNNNNNDIYHSNNSGEEEDNNNNNDNNNDEQQSDHQSNHQTSSNNVSGRNSMRQFPFVIVVSSLDPQLHGSTGSTDGAIDEQTIGEFVTMNLERRKSEENTVNYIPQFMAQYHQTPLANYELKEIYGALDENTTDDTSVDDDCVICLSEEKQIILLPCRHLCVCGECFKQIDKCPICRTALQSYIVLKPGEVEGLEELQATALPENDTSDRTEEAQNYTRQLRYFGIV